MKIKNVIALLCAILSLAALCAGCAIAVADSSAQLAGTEDNALDSTPSAQVQSQHASSSGTTEATQPMSASAATVTTEPATVPSGTIATQPSGIRTELCGPEWSEALSVEMQIEIETTWYAVHDAEYTSEFLRYGYYYGTYDGCVVYMRVNPIYGRNYYAYKDGEFLRLNVAYEKGWLTSNHIDLINAYNRTLFDKDALKI